MTESAKTGRTIHVHRDQFHRSWDNSIAPIASIQSGEVVEFDLLDAAGGQIVARGHVLIALSLDSISLDRMIGLL